MELPAGTVTISELLGLLITVSMSLHILHNYKYSSLSTVTLLMMLALNISTLIHCDSIIDSVQGQGNA
jgi:hypothetical protein